MAIQSYCMISVPDQVGESHSGTPHLNANGHQLRIVGYVTAEFKKRVDGSPQFPKYKPNDFSKDPSPQHLYPVYRHLISECPSAENRSSDVIKVPKSSISLILTPEDPANLD